RREERRAWRAARRSERDGMGAIVFGLLLVLVGGFFLLRTYVPALDADRFWPLVLVVIGAVFVIGAIRPGRGNTNS
ncbi:MAG TPA: DUF5668 domain-containing protein, partial [Candidatus Limnocylindrales bacterium]